MPCPHTKEVLAKVLMDTLYEYSLETKVSSVVVDNCTTNDAMMEILHSKFDVTSLILSGDFLHMRCSAHILNLVVRDGLEVISGAIELIRENIAFWLATPKRIEAFNDSVRSLKISATKSLSLDCKTRWNSTYLMLLSAFPYKDVFVRAKKLNPTVKIALPQPCHWEMAEKICKKLEIFYKATKLFSGKNYPTSNLFFSEICDIKLRLHEWLESDTWEISLMAQKMMEKFDKYWSSINGLLAIAAILDPRLKLDCVQFYFSLIYGESGAEREVERVSELLINMLIEYKDAASEGNASSASYPPTSENVNANGKRPASTLPPSSGSMYSQHKKNNIGRKVNVRSELDRYLEDEPIQDDRSFDILGYWKNTMTYTTLRQMARDILAIPVSSVASESAFSTGGRVVSSHRSRLHAKTVEALMCLQSWMVGDHSGNVQF